VQQYPHAVLIPVDDYNIVPYLYATDTLISEASSTMFDFVALYKTGIIFVLPSEPLKHHDGEALLAEEPQHFLQGAFLHISRPDEIRAAVAEALRDDPQRRACIRQYRDYLFFGLDGQASQRTKDIIERLLAEGGHANCP
jgi:CDP-glycerol glycerophosphotransferase (TagB/SpsB family)